MTAIGQRMRLNNEQHKAYIMNKNTDFQQEFPCSFPLRIAAEFGAVAIEQFPTAMKVGGRSAIGVNRMADVLRSESYLDSTFRTAVLARPGDIVPANGFGHVRVFWNRTGEIYCSINGKHEKQITLGQLADLCYEVAKGFEVAV